MSKEASMRRGYDPEFVKFVRRAKIAGLVFAVLWAGAIVVGFHEYEGRRADRDAQVRQLCEAVPNTAAASAQALIDILVADAQRRHMPSAQINETRRLGALYVSRARELALDDLPACPKEKP